MSVPILASNDVDYGVISLNRKYLGESRAIPALKLERV